MTRSGRYLYFLNGEQADVEETWCVRGTLGKGETAISSQRCGPGFALSVQAQALDRCIESFEVQWQAGEREPLVAHYQCTEHGARCELLRGARVLETRDDLNSTAGGRLLMFPLMRIFMGPLLRQLLSGTADVLLPCLADPGDENRLLRPEISSRSASRVAVEAISFAGQRWNCERIAYVGGRYQDGAGFWLDDEDYLRRYRWRESDAREWDVWLERD